jgi:glycine/D-amino acid oxidase-like deaminating enzyme
MGILSAPATAHALTGLIADGRSPLPIEALAPSRLMSTWGVAPSS